MREGSSRLSLFSNLHDRGFVTRERSDSGSEGDPRRSAMNRLILTLNNFSIRSLKFLIFDINICKFCKSVQRLKGVIS